MIDVETLRASCLQGDFLEGACRLLSAELERNPKIGAAADEGDIAKVADWLNRETSLLEALSPLVPANVLLLASVSTAKRLIWNQPGLTPEGAMRSEMSLGAAIRRGHLTAVRLMIARGWDVNAPQANGQTPLFLANAYQQTEIAGVLSAHGAQVMPKPQAPETGEAVSAAASIPLAPLIAQTADRIQRHLQKASSALTADAQDAAFQAAKSGDMTALTRLLGENKALATAARDRNQNSALHQAATASVAALLLDSGADVNARGWMGNMPLHDAASRGNLEVVRLLIKRGADVRATRTYAMTALHWAARGGHAEVAEFLIAQGAAADAEDGWGETPLANAIKGRHDDCAVRLITLGADVCHQPQIGSQSTVWEGATPLHWAAKYGRVVVARALLNNGASPNAEDSTGNTALHQAAATGHRDMAALLVEAGADLQRRNHRFNTPRYEAKENAHPAIVSLLREQEAAAGLPLLPEPPLAQIVRAHPSRPEAVTTARRGVLAHWICENGVPRLLASFETAHSHFDGLAVSQDGAEVVVLTPENAIERRAWDHLQSAAGLKDLMKIEDRLEAVALSPDGRWIALAGGGEEIHLLDADTGKSMAKVDGGERTGPLVFDPAGVLLASACSFQGGALVRLDRVTSEGLLVPVYEDLSRSDYQTPADQFIDTLGSLAFSPDSRWLALFETSAIYQERYPLGWRGNLVVFSVETGKAVWSASIDASVTHDARSLREIGEPMGFATEILFLDDARLLCGTSQGTLLVYQIAGGALLERISLGDDASVRSLSRDGEGTVWVVLSSGELVCTTMAGS